MKNLANMLRAVPSPRALLRRAGAALADLFEDGDGHFVRVEHPRQLILQSRQPISADTYARIRDTVANWTPDQGPIVFDGGLEVVGAINPPIKADGPMVLAPVIGGA